MSRHLIVNFSGNYADEFDVSAYQIFTEEQWETFQTHIKNVTEHVELYFGTNEAIEYENGKQFLKDCSIHQKGISDDEIFGLKTFDLTLDHHGIFENIIENYTNSTFYAEMYN